MYGRGNIRVWEGVVELRTRPLLAYDCNRNGLRFFMEILQRGCGWLMQVVVTSMRCLRSYVLSQRLTKKIVEIAKVLKTPPFLICFVCSR
jgi:hypothetical protein